jgi:hypothetical protein
MILRHDYSDSIVQKTTTATFFIGQSWRNIMKADKKRKKDGEERRGEERRKTYKKCDRKRETERKGEREKERKTEKDRMRQRNRLRKTEKERSKERGKTKIQCFCLNVRRIFYLE